MEGSAIVRLLDLPDPRLVELGLNRDDVSYLAEEMSSWGLDPNEILEEAYLKARALFLAGRIDDQEMLRLVQKYQQQYLEKDLAIGLSLS